MSFDYATSFRYLIPALFLAAACGPGNPDPLETPAPGDVPGANPGSGPCATDSPPALCGTSCTADDTCGPGLYCGSAGACTAECTLTGGQCGAGQVCNERGRCASAPPPPDPGSGDNGCPRVDVGLSALTPTVIFLIDRSGSMGEQRFGSKLRWDALRDALVGDEGVITQLANRVVFGAAAYNDNTRGACPDLLEVRPKLENRNAIAMLMQDYRPFGATPTGDAFLALLSSLEDNPPPSESPAIIILATDGEPNTCSITIPRYPDELEEVRAYAVAGAQAAFDQGYRTYVLSVGSDITTDHLQDMANAGAGLPLDTPDDAPFFVANDQAQLVAALVQIIGGERSCEIAVDGGTVDTRRSGEGEVLLNGSALAYETEWTVSADGTKIILLGDICQRFLETPDVALQASFPCGVIVE